MCWINTELTVNFKIFNKNTADVIYYIWLLHAITIKECTTFYFQCYFHA